VSAAMGKLTPPPSARYGPGEEPDVEVDKNGGLIFSSGKAKRR
jgi:hypothetical protein